ncbi:MAG TPA: cohesin domain-containing protein, partial [Thermoanaerobaculia bacterium]|nr:cohesin domain-containing protein [Thermoanaerobaculia bacterium]
PQRLTVEPGALFEVRLQASAVRPLAHLPLTLEFDPEVLVVEQVVAGDFLGAEGEAQVLSDTTRAGRLVLGASRLGQRGGARGAGTVARITFRALAAGATRVRFAEARALDPLLQPLAPFAAESAEISVAGAPPARPEPDLRRIQAPEGEDARPRS